MQAGTWGDGMAKSDRKPNKLFREARERLFESREALAEAVNLNLPAAFLMSANDIGKIERGVVTYPRPPRRAALRKALRVEADTEIGLYDTRDLSPQHLGRLQSPESTAAKRTGLAEGDPRSSRPRPDHRLIGVGTRLQSGTLIESREETIARVRVQGNPRHVVHLREEMDVDAAIGLVRRPKAETERGSTTSQAKSDDDPRRHGGVAEICMSDSRTWQAPGGKPPQVALEWAEKIRHSVADPRRYADRSLVDVLWLQLETAKAIDGRFGPAAALSTARGVIEVVESMIPGVPERVRRELAVLGADAAEFVGWLFRDLAHAVQAGYWYDQAMEYAQICGDLPIQGFVLLRKSQLAYESRSGHYVRMLARAAIDGPWQLAPPLHAEALLQVARGDAMVGQNVDMDYATRQARDVAEGEDLTLREASCWIEANQPDRAAQLYEDGLANERVSIRDVGYYRARQAIALAQAAQPDLAAEWAREALATSVRTGSSRTYSAVQKVCGILAPWQACDAVVALTDALAATRLPIQR